jgi:exodeoxyribonuclease VII large subunit
MVNRLVPAPKAILERHGARLAEKLARLRLLSPQNVLDRGYSLTFDAETGRVVRDAAWVRAGDRLRTRLRRGEVTSVATLVTGLDPVREGPKGG